MDISIVKIKSQIIRSIRRYFEEQGYVEVDTPILVSAPDPSIYHEVFETKSITGEKLYLIPSPEFYLKRLIGTGIRNIYQITKCFRDNKENNATHRREFMMIEWYRDGASYTDLMTECTDLTNFIVTKIEEYQAISGTNDISNFFHPPLVPWSKISCKEAFMRYAGVNLDNFIDINNARKICRQKGYCNQRTSWEEMYHQIFLNEVEPELVNIPAFFLYDYPKQLAELSQEKITNPDYAERFEWYMNGMEIGNGYSELTDGQELEKRLRAELSERRKRKMKVFNYDHNLVGITKSGMPKTAGIAVGIDRLVMALTGEKDIANICPYNL